MRYVYHVTAALLVFAVYVTRTGADPNSAEGYRLPNELNYLALAPKLVRPEHTYTVYVTLYRLQYPALYVRATLSNEGEEYATALVTFEQEGTRSLQMHIYPLDRPGNHSLTVEGEISEGSGELVFQNTTTVYYQNKYVSLFIALDQPLYYAEQTAKFSVVGITPFHQAVTGQITVYLEDAKGIIVKRWIQKQLNLGIYTDSFVIPYPVNIGKWKLIVQGFGETYIKEFVVKFYYMRRFDVIINAPLYITDSDYGVVGTIEGEHTSCAYIYGNGTITAWVREEDGTYLGGNITHVIPTIANISGFEFTMEELRAEFGDITGKEVFMKAWLYDWFWQETINGTAVTKVYLDEIRVKALGKRYRPFKPETTFEVNFAVMRGPGAPYTGFYHRTIVVSTSFFNTETGSRALEEIIMIPDDSIVRYAVTPQVGDWKINVRAWSETTMQVAEIECYKYWSDQKKYIALSTSTEQATVDSYMVLTLRTNFYIEEVNFLVMADGAIITGDVIRMQSTQKTFGVALSRDMAPAARIVVYCKEDGVILTDAMTFYVKDTKLMEGELIINYGKDFKGDNIELIGRAEPGGFLSLMGYHRDLYNRGGITFIEEERVTRELLTYNNGTLSDIDSPQHHIWYDVDGRWDKSVFFPEPSTGIDFITTFNVSGLVVLSESNLTVPDHDSGCNSTLGYLRCLDGSCFDVEKLCDNIVDCTSDGYDEMGCPNLNHPEPRPDRLDDLHLVARHFPQTDWTWKRTYIKHTGQSEVLLDVPDIQRDFMLSAFMLHPEQGLSVIDRPLPYDTRRLFTMNVEVPPAWRRGEQIGVRCTLFNFWDEDLEVIVMLHGSTLYRFVAVEEFGIVSSYSPRTITGDVQTMVNVYAGEHRYVHMPVIPMIQEGFLTVTVSSYSILRRDIEVREVEVTYDGVLNDDQTPYLLDLVNSGSQIIPDFDVVMPEQYYVPGQRELLYVPGSNWCVMFVWGDLVSPGFYIPFKTAMDIVTEPHDSADGYLFDFAINLQCMTFLRGANVLDPDDEQASLDFIISIIPRQFSYMNDDGSFVMWRRQEVPCIWLTSWVLEVFHEAIDSEWSEELFIEIEPLDRMATWLINEFNRETNRWEETTEYYYDRNMRPWVKDWNNETQAWHVPVTAHVIITLSQAHRLSADVKNDAQEVIFLASDYLVSIMYNVSDPYTICMIAYALYAAGHPKQADAYIIMKTMSRNTEGYIYWAAIEVPGNPFHVVDTRTILLGRGDFINQANSMYGTSYALMLYLANNEIAAAEPIMKWLHLQHNDVHMHSSTRDTLLALKAMIKYSDTQTNRDFYNIEIEYTATCDQNWHHTVNINSSNFAHRWELYLYEAWGEVRAQAKGTGFAFMHFSCFHNVEHQFLVNNPEWTKPFYFEMKEQRSHGRNNTYVDYYFCIKFLRPDIANYTGMVYVKMALPTGYIVSRDTIEWMHQQGFRGLRRARYRNGLLVMFFNEVWSHEETCVETRIDRWYPVANVSIGYLTNVFEYSESGIQTNFIYESYTLFQQHICQVCGSFQCPYCPFYNDAPPITKHGTISIVLPLTFVFYILWYCKWTL